MPYTYTEIEKITAKAAFITHRGAREMLLEITDQVTDEKDCADLEYCSYKVLYPDGLPAVLNLLEGSLREQVPPELWVWLGGHLICA